MGGTFGQDVLVFVCEWSCWSLSCHSSAMLRRWTWWRGRYLIYQSFASASWFIEKKNYKKSEKIKISLERVNISLKSNEKAIRSKTEGEQKAKVYSTRYSQAVSHPSTNRARRCLTSVIGREPVYSTRLDPPVVHRLVALANVTTGRQRVQNIVHFLESCVVAAFALVLSIRTVRSVKHAHAIAV